MAKNILIIGDETDLHIISVYKFLEEGGANILVLNPADGNSGKITYSFSPFQLTFTDIGKTIDYTDITAVWWRLKPNMRSTPSDMSESATAGFISREWQLSLEPLRFFLKHAVWINNRSADLAIRNKPYQLYLAGKYGFRTPETIISNNYDLIQKESSKFKEVLYKPLSYFAEQQDKILFSNRMTMQELENFGDNISLAPCIFQNYVDKDHELRITVVDDTAFAVKIYSQEDELSKFDWRRNLFKVKYEAVALEKEFEKKLLKFHKAIDLVYGAYDFIVDKKGEPVFLEVNHVGQWLWLENMLNIEISKKIADTLLRA